VNTTLIVAPAMICHQWYEELRRHVKTNLKIDVNYIILDDIHEICIFQMYRGVSDDGYKHPMYLAQCDVVICSYETMRNETNFVDINMQTCIVFNS
jgi:hypothetical protein